MGFDDVEDFPATQEWELTADMMTEDAEPLQVRPPPLPTLRGAVSAATLSSAPPPLHPSHPPSPTLQTKYVKFQKVTGLQFFFENEEGEVSAISRIQLFGSAGDAVDVGECLCSVFPVLRSECVLIVHCSVCALLAHADSSISMCRGAQRGSEGCHGRGVIHVQGAAQPNSSLLYTHGH